MNRWFRFRATDRSMPRKWMILCLLTGLCFTAPRTAPSQQQQVPPIGSTAGTSRASYQTDSAAEIEKLKEEIQQLKTMLMDLRIHDKAIENYLTFAPEVRLHNEDYAQARLRFHTKLLRRGPAPQAGKLVEPPTGVTEVEYSSGGLRLKAWINRPSDQTAKHPAVLFLHGGFAFDKSDWDQTRPYRDAGFVVLAPILRAEKGQPGAFSYFYDEVNDVLAAADYLRRQPYVDASRLFVAGHSIGGTMTLLAAITSKQFRAAAAFSGAAYWPAFTQSQDLPFDKSDSREILMRTPIAYADSVKCPLRLYYGTEETSFFGPMSQQFAALAKRSGLNVEATEVEGNHRSHVRRSMMQSIVFFQKIASQESTPWKGEKLPLPKTSELDLGRGVKMKFVRIEPGKFQMGSPLSEAGQGNNETQHEVEIPKPYSLGIFEVTQAQYRQIMGRNLSDFSAKGDSWDVVVGLNTDDFPVENVSWEEAMDFCRILSMLPEVRNKGWIVDLPSEAEWEYAARAGTETPFSFGNSLFSDQANFDGNHPYGGAAKGPLLNRTAKVGSYPANSWGLFDMHGNVMEWCKDSYDKNYLNKDNKDASQRVTRGGGWLSSGEQCRSAFRLPTAPSIQVSGVGFRVVIRSS